MAAHRVTGKVDLYGTVFGTLRASIMVIALMK